MSVIAIVNRKGGSGKSTLATNLAAWFASEGVAVMLGDVDRQQSTQTWLRARGALQLPGSAPIVGWAVDPKRVLRPPAGVRHVVLDTPGGLRGFDLARVVAFADAILMPVCNSVFDRESAAECHAEMQALPRVASGRCKVAAVGMRIDARTHAAAALAAWADELKLPFVGVLRETQAYVRHAERGLSAFDLPQARGEIDVAQWRPVVRWVDGALQAPPPPLIVACNASRPPLAARASAVPVVPEAPVSRVTPAVAPTLAPAAGSFFASLRAWWKPLRAASPSAASLARLPERRVVAQAASGRPT